MGPVASYFGRGLKNTQ